MCKEKILKIVEVSKEEHRKVEVLFKDCKVIVNSVDGKVITANVIWGNITDNGDFVYSTSRRGLLFDMSSSEMDRVLKALKILEKKEEEKVDKHSFSKRCLEELNKWANIKYPQNIVKTSENIEDDLNEEHRNIWVDGFRTAAAELLNSKECDCKKKDISEEELRNVANSIITEIYNYLKRTAIQLILKDSELEDIVINYIKTLINNGGKRS